MKSAASLLAVVVAACIHAAQPAFAAGRDGYDQHVLLPPAPVIEAPAAGQPVVGATHDFTLRHIYHRGAHKYPGLHRKVDIHPDILLLQDGVEEPRVATREVYTASSKPVSIQRMVDRSKRNIDSVLQAGALQGQAASLPVSAWATDDVQGPNITDKKTVVSFANMAANAYVTVPRTGDWEDVKGGFNYTEDFGWEEDGLRGHIFADPTNSTVVIGLKGTSMAIFDGADTTSNDKINDNLFGSCCCAQGGQYWWKQVCDCQTSTYTCNNTCLIKNLREKGHYYHAARDLYHNVTERYPNANIWLTGHSLGGVVTALLGLTYGQPAVTFEAFPDALAASRLGLPTPPGYHIGSHHSRPDTGIHHFGHSADPVYMALCNGASSACTIGGYAFQSQCHTGSTCTYDTVGDLGWRVGIGTHRITSVIRDVIKKYDSVPVCEQDVECVDCFNWKFYESNGTESTTSSKSSTYSTSTRTATCQTPGWWGCLDETTTSPVTQTSTTTVTTCLTPGWFGCKDGSTTYTSTATITTQTEVPVPTVTTTSWAKPKPPSSSSPTASQTGEPTCTSKEWFGFVCVDPSPVPTVTAKAKSWLH